MMGGTLSQPYVFAAAMYAGMLCACLYILLRAIGKIIKINVLIIVLDGVFALLAVGIVFIALYISSNANLRLYQFIGVILGFVLMNFAIRPIFLQIYEKFHKNIDKRRKKGSNIR